MSTVSASPSLSLDGRGLLAIRDAFLRYHDARTREPVDDGLPKKVSVPVADRLTANNSLGKSIGSFIILALPALLPAWLIWQYGVNTPWGDQWDGMAHLFEKMQAGTLGLSDFFAFHNEHRIFFPRLLSFGLARLTHWNIRAEMFVVWLLLCVCAFNIWRLALVTGWRESRHRDWLLLASNVLLFTVLQWENLLWGFQIGFVFPLAALTASLWVAMAAPRPFDFLGTMALCLISTFSIASGCASWLLTAPLLLCWNGKAASSREKLWWCVWGLVAASSIFFYFHGFARPKGHPSELNSLSHPLFALQFFFAYLGSPFASGTSFTAASVAPIVGGILLATFLGSAACLWHRRKNKILLAQAWPWISLAGIGLTNGLLTTLGRAGFGISAALPPRYVSFAITLPIALLFLVPLLVRRKLRVAGGLLASAFAVLFLFASIHVFTYLPGFQHKLFLGKSVVLLSDILDEPVELKRYVHWMGPELRPRINTLDQIGYLHPALIRSRDIAGIAVSPRGELMGQLTNLGRRGDGDWAAGGWAILPAQHRVADSVLLAYEDVQGSWMIFARADVALSMPAIAQRFDDETYQSSGWIKSWSPAELPAGTQRISAWAFDAETCHAYPIGTVSL